MIRVALQGRAAGQVARLTIEREAKLNSLDSATLEAIAREVRALAGEVRAVVLTGAGARAFAGGANLAELAALDPVKNSELVQQVSTIRQISATTSLEDSLQAVTTSQNLASASALIGKNVKALADNGTDVTGVVTKATVQVDEKTDARTYRIQIGSSSVQLKNVREVIDE